jgi:hypothetical protein
MALLGFPKKAMKLGNEALTLARSLSHPYSLALAMWQFAIVLQVGRQRQSCRDLATELLEVSHQNDFSDVARRWNVLLWMGDGGWR